MPPTIVALGDRALMRTTGTDREAAINLPGLLTVSCLVLIAIQAIRGFLPERTDLEFLLDLAFIPGPWSVALGTATPDDLVSAATLGVDDPALAGLRAAFAAYLAGEGASRPWTLVSYALLHGSWLHVGLNCVWLAAFGAPVVRRIGTARALGLAVATAIGGVVAHWLVHPASTQPVIGASAIVSGFMAAAATFVFNRPPGERIFDHPETRRRASVAAMLRNRSALLFLGSWLIINVLFGLLAGPLGVVEGGVAWEAHIGGLLVGLALFPLLDPTRAGDPPP